MRSAASIPAVCLIAGSALGAFVETPSLAWAAATLLPALAAAAWAWRTSRANGLLAAAGTGFFVGAALLSSSAWQHAWRPPLRLAFEDLARQERAQAALTGTLPGRRPPEDDEAFAVVSGTLRADAAVTETGVSIAFDVDAIGVRSNESPTSSGLPLPVFGGVQATVAGTLAAGRAAEWRAGRRVTVPVQLHRAARYLDPGVPDLERALARRGTTLVGTVKSGALVDVVARGSWLDESAAEVRAFSRRAISRAVGSWSPRSGAIVAAIVIGDRGGLDDEVQHRLQDAGTYHVLAISGGNIAILAGLMLAGFRLAGMLGRTASVSAIVVLLAYAKLVGGGASVDRATLMAVLYLAAGLVDQRSWPLNTLALSAACLVAALPLSVFDPAFLLTFGATLAILWVAPLARAWRVPRPFAPLVSMFLASLATEALLLPVGAIVFSRVTFAGLALNFVAIPLMALVQIAGMALVPLSLFSSPGAASLGYVAHLGATALVKSADLAQYVPALAFRVAPPAWWAVITYYLAIVVSVCWWRHAAWRWLGPTGAAAMACWMVLEPWTLLPNRGDGRLHVTFLDVGQGDAALIRFPRGSTLLVDAGGLPGAGFDLGERVVAPVLRQAGVRRLDAIALTHGDPDHIGGAGWVLREFRPRQVWEGIEVPPSQPLRVLRADADAVHAKWRRVTAGDRAVFDDVDAIVWHPGAADWERQKVRNDDSIVMELRWRDVSVLLTGDIGSAVERTLLTVPRAGLRVVKVPHHGSLTSSTVEFVAALAPRVAVASAGRANHFGHPVAEVLERYRSVGAEVFRTDQDGAVSIDTDGYSLSVTTFTGREFSVR